MSIIEKAVKRLDQLKTAAGERHAFELAQGDLLLMSGDSQRRYRHALPRTAKPVGPRINLTFRRIVPPTL